MNHNINNDTLLYLDMIIINLVLNNCYEIKCKSENFNQSKCTSNYKITKMCNVRF